MKNFLLFLILSFLSIPLQAQQGNVVLRNATTGPSGNCSVLQVWVNNTTPSFSFCKVVGGVGTWVTFAGGGTIGSPVAGGTAGSMLFVDSGGNIGQDNANLFWDNINKRFQVGSRTGYISSFQTGFVDQSIHVFGSLNPTLARPLLALMQLNNSAPSNTFVSSGVAVANHSSGTKVNILGVDGEAYSEGTGTVTNLVGIGSFVEVDGTGPVTLATGQSAGGNYIGVGASVTTVAGIDIPSNYCEPGTCTNNIGIEIHDQGGVAANNWAFKTGTGIVSLGDQVGGSGTNLGSESLNEPSFATNIKWTAAGDFAFAGQKAVYTDATHAGTITQTAGNQVQPALGTHDYTLGYTISGFTGDVVCTVTTGYLAAAATLDMTAGAHTQTVRSKTTPGSVVFSCTSTSGGVSLDDVSLKPLYGGALKMYGPTQDSEFLFADIATFLTANGQHGYCHDCDAPSVAGTNNACASAAGKAGASAEYVRGAAICH